MHVNDCHCVCSLDARGEEGFTVVVSRTKTVIETDAQGNQKPIEVKIERGPFFKIQTAQRYAHAWNDIDNPPPLESFDPQPAAQAGRRPVDSSEAASTDNKTEQTSETK